MSSFSLTLKNRLAIADAALCCFVFFPSMLCYWRGIWDLVGVYILPNRTPAKLWLWCAIGACSILGYAVLPILDRVLDRKKRILYVVVTRAVMYVYAALYMTFWRGVWEISDYYFTTDLKWNLLHLVICYGILLASRASRSITFSPMIVIPDFRDDLLKTSTVFRTQPDNIAKHVLDCLYTHYIVIVATIMSWRSYWNIFGAFMTWDNMLLSNGLSLIIGMVLIGGLYLLQHPFSQLSKHLHRAKRPWTRLAWEDAAYFMVFTSLVFLWRGGWNLNAEYMVKDPLVGGWVNLVVGTVLMLGMGIFSYVSAVGCGMDGYDQGGGAFYENKYLRLYFKDKLDTKQTKEDQAAAQHLQGKVDDDVIV